MLSPRRWALLCGVYLQMYCELVLSGWVAAILKHTRRSDQADLTDKKVSQIKLPLSMGILGDFLGFRGRKVRDDAGIAGSYLQHAHGSTGCH